MGRVSERRMRRFSITELQTRCLIEATIGPLIAFRRGFGRSKAGPFFELKTFQPLVDSGALRAVFPVHGKRGLQLTAVAV